MNHAPYDWLYQRSRPTPLLPYFWGAALLLVVIAAVGCEPPPRPVLGRIDRNNEIAPPLGDPLETAEATQTPRAHAADWETWQAYYMDGRHVGTNHIATALDSQADPPQVRIRMEDQLMLSRGAAQVSQRLEQHSVETPAGELVSFNASLAIGPAVTRFTGSIEDRQLVIVTARGTEQSTRRIPWEPHYSGLIGIQQTLKAAPLGVGDSRRLTVLLPIAYDLATVDLNCRFTASIPMPDGSVRQAREIDVAIQPTQAPAFQTVIWTDEQGEVLKSLSPAINLLAFSSAATDAQAAMGDGGMPTTAMLAATGSFLSPDQTAVQVAFRFTRRGAAPTAGQAAALQPQPGQWVKPLPQGSFDIAVSRKPLSAPPNGFQGVMLLPTAEDRQASTLVDSGHNRVRQLAATAVAGNNDPARLARQLARTAHSLVRTSPNTKGLVAASEVAMAGTADSTGHAVLLTAMLRARNIPARVAVGLAHVPSEGQPTMAYRMWTLAYVGDDWIQLDASLPNGEAAADRVILATHSLGGKDSFDVFAPVLDSLGRFDIEIVRANYGTLPDLSGED